jgi:hypothetical protein
VHYLTSPCRRCDAQTLQRKNGDDKATCRTCVGQWTAFFARVLQQYLDDAEPSAAGRVPSTLGDRYDALLWFGETTALQPLRSEPTDDPEPETVPTGE